MRRAISSKVGSAPGLSASDIVLIWSLFFAGQLPKELGKLVNLKAFKVYGNKIEGQLSIRTERLHVLLTFQLFGRRIAQGARQFDQFDPLQSTVE